MKRKCPKCGGTEFSVNCTVIQKWLVDSNGAYLETLEDCIDTISGPEDDDTWKCDKCGFEAPREAFKPHNMIGTVVTIIVDHPCAGDRGFKVKNETGIIHDFNEVNNTFQIRTGLFFTNGFWYRENEFRPATDDEIKARLKLILGYSD